MILVESSRVCKELEAFASECTQLELRWDWTKWSGLVAFHDIVLLLLTELPPLSLRRID
jgi:hypothetical protein